MLLLGVSARRLGRDHNLLDRVAFTAVAPAQWAVAHGQRAVARLVQRTLLLGQAERRAEALAAENQRLTWSLAALSDVVEENHRLRQLMALRGRAGSLPLVAAEVIATSPSPSHRSLRIDRGRGHGLHLGAAVVGPEGAVGRIAALGERFADVLLLADSTCSLDVVVVRTRARARVHGGGDPGELRLSMQYLSRTADVVPGDVVVSSGLGGTFPKGIRVGTIASTARQAYGLYQEAAVEPSIDFSRLELVMVVAQPPEGAGAVSPTGEEGALEGAPGAAGEGAP